MKTWYDEINSPLIQQDGNDKHLKLRFDVSQYAPEEIVVKTVDNKLLVSVLESYVTSFLSFKKTWCLMVLFVLFRFMQSMKKRQNPNQCTENTTENSFFQKEPIQNR